MGRLYSPLLCEAHRAVPAIATRSVLYESCSVCVCTHTCDACIFVIWSVWALYTCVCLPSNSTLNTNELLWFSTALVVHCPLTSHTVSPCTLPTDPFDHLLTNCSLLLVLTWKALFQYRPDSLHLISFKSSLKMHLFCAVFTRNSEIKGGGGEGGLQSVWLTGEPLCVFVCGSGGAQICVVWVVWSHACVCVSQCGWVYVCL